MSLPALTDAWVGRRRAWVLAGCAGLLVLVYLVGWTAYAANGLTVLGRLDQRAPGEPGTALGAEYRLLSLTRTDEIRDEESPDRSAVAAGNATWVVAVVEVVRRQEQEDYYCSFELVGPDRRRWDPDPPLLQRTLTSYCRAEDLPLGRPGRVEIIFEVPTAFLDRIHGVAVPDAASRRATPVLRPPV